MYVLILFQVDADELLGICGVGRQNTKAMLIFVLIPQLLFLVLGIVAFLYCSVYLLKVARMWNHSCILQSPIQSQLDTQQQLRYLTYSASDRQLEMDKKLENEASCTGSGGCFSCCCKSLCWDGLSTRLGFFSLLYIVPAVCIVACDFYEYLNRDDWLKIGSGGAQLFAKTADQETAPEIFLLRTFMSLVIGFATCLWLLSNKGIEPWRQLALQIEARCARSGCLCFATPMKTQTPVTNRQLPNPNLSEYGKLKDQPASQMCTPSNASTVLHPYAVYQHCCSSLQSDHCDMSEQQQRCHQAGSSVLLAARPPAGPGLDASEQFFMQPISSVTHASGYYSSATNSGKISNFQPAPCPPPNTPPPLPGTGASKLEGGSSQGISIGWYSTNGTGPKNSRRAIL